MKRRLRVILCGLLALVLVLCLFPMPYGYYQLVRFLAMSIFAYLAYCEYKEDRTDSMILFIALSVLFQPFVPFALGRVIWNCVDVIVAAYLVYWMIKTIKK